MTAKSQQKLETVSYVTPWFAARFPKISAPDTKGKFADGKFKTDGIFLSDEDKEAAIAAGREAAATLWPNVPVEDVALPFRVFTDKDRDDKSKVTEAGWGLTLKSKYRPAVFDAKKKKLPEGAKIGGGSVIRVASAFFPWEKTETETVIEDGKKTKRQVTAYGISLRLGDVQVRKLVEGAGQGDGSAFDEVEGFEYEGDGGGEQFGSGDSATDL